MDQGYEGGAAARRLEHAPDGSGPIPEGEGGPTSSQVAVVGEVASSGLVAARLEAIEDDARVTLRVGSAFVEAGVDLSVDAAVLRTALRRGEPVIAQREGGRWVVLGALRTAATPGVDEGEEFTLKARRIAVEAAHEFSVVTGAASLVLRAYGHVETLAQDITARASGVHKIIGRMIRLN